MAEEEVMMEVEAVKAVYAEDCTFFCTFPPHLLLHIKPRTADDSSLQFVEASIEIQAGSQYPSDPPIIKIASSKGLDQKRLKDLTASLHDKALDLLPCSMLVALCEEAVEKLSIMNHPEGDCPLCLCPLVTEDDQDDSSSFMKLMSCFHCFHRDCIIRWWKWLQAENGVHVDNSPSNARDLSNAKHQRGEMGNCPVCRKVFHADDIKHVLDLVGSCHLQSTDIHDKESLEDERILQSDSEINRRSKFETALQVQKECGGLIEPRTVGVLFTSMRLSESAPDLSPELTTDSIRQSNDPVPEPAGPHIPSCGEPRVMPTGHEARQGSSRGRASGQRRGGGARKSDRKSSRSQAKQWVQKDR